MLTPFHGPGRHSQMHFPPDTCVFHGFDPGEVLNFGWIIEIEDEFAFDKIAGSFGDLNGAPGRMEGECHYRFDGVGATADELTGERETLLIDFEGHI